MKLLSNILYFCILKPWLWLSFQLFYQKIDVFNRKGNIPKGPLLLVSNHPNTLMDVVLSGIFTRRKVHFLANAGLFRTAFNRWFFTLVFSIPIERRQDSGSRKLDNQGSFSRCIEFLEKGGCLYIAPEGSSWVERHLRPLKTGTARIALTTEAANDFMLGLQVLPLGINYADQQAFQSQVSLSFGKPISILQYKDLAQEHQRRAAQQLTDDI
ncbi:MAG: 1-acyl-sn-glycerol-3-phosphate acyltransferase [Phaeodactylibacter sp.]|nr:1-acyl-sn-glycerol-3-phosphate acyltransferase [Phaeodactylibacter sp.]